MVKLIMTWNIRPGKEPEYLEFLTKEFGEAVVGMGIQPTDAWYAVWGRGPQVLAGGVTETLAEMERALASPEWTKLQSRLSELVEDLDHKVVQQEGGFQL